MVAAGSGAGLNRVADLAQMYGGHLSLQNADLGGLEVPLVLPAQALQ